MITIKNLKPQYIFEGPQTDVILIENEPVKIYVGKDKDVGNGKAILYLGRKPRIKIIVSFASDDTYNIFHKRLSQNTNEKTILELIARNIKLENGYIHSFSAHCDNIHKNFTIVWEPLQEPFVVRGNGSTEINYLAFHLINCPKLSFPNTKEIIENKGWYRTTTITLRWKDWVIEFKSMKETDKNIKLVKESGGFGLTYIGIIRKENNSLFKVDDIKLLREGFSLFMDFVVGRRCWPSLCVGYKNNNKVYEDWGATFSDWYIPMTWATGKALERKASETLEVLFPLFMNLFKEEQPRSALRECISWYLSTTEPGRPYIDQALILLQAGIERLSYEYAVNQKKLIHKTGFKDLRASDKFRILFASLGIPLNIPAELIKLNKLAKKFHWEDVPHCLTEIRNAIVHPEHRKKGQIKSSYVDSWQLAIEYLELSILSFCKYTGQYYSRIHNKSINVPWS